MPPVDIKWYSGMCYNITNSCLIYYINIEIETRLKRKKLTWQFIYNDMLFSRPIAFLRLVMSPRGHLISFGWVSCAIDSEAFLSLSISTKQKLLSAMFSAFWRSCTCLFVPQAWRGVHRHYWDLMVWSWNPLVH